jgi:hypothetical protein
MSGFIITQYIVIQHAALACSARPPYPHRSEPMSSLALAHNEEYEGGSDEEAIQEEDEEYEYSRDGDNDDGSRTRRQSDVDMEA